MTRPFFSMGPHKSRASIASTSTCGFVGAAPSSLIIAPRNARFSGTSQLRGNGVALNESSTWNPGSPVFTFGNSDTYDVSATGPSGYELGGVYDALSGSPLPAGIVLSQDGILSDTGAEADSVSGVIFGYTEPNALPVLTLHSGVTGTFPYEATVYPAEGAVPNGAMIFSETDANLRSSVLSEWPDGSAQVAVVAGRTDVSAGGTKSISLHAGLPTGSPLTSSRVGMLISRVDVDFGGGMRTLSNFSSPDWTWWSNERVICARYRLDCGKGVMEAVIDIHAFDTNWAFVEVVIENGRLSPASPVKPTGQTYSNATVSVNGTAITSAPVSNPSSSAAIGTYTSQNVNWTTSTHEPFRAWYCSGWVGGNPGIAVTHDTASMQAHPAFFKMDKPSTVNVLTYAGDTQQPWHTGRYQPSMGSGGDAAHIGIYPEWECLYLQTGNKTVRNAVVANALNSLAFDFNYRDLSGNVPNFTDIGNKDVQNSNWPVNYTKPSTNKSGAGHTHNPSVGLMAFLCQPSPCFIEIAQKACVFNIIWNNWGYGPYAASAEVRGKAWGIRDHAQALFLTPDVHPWKAPGRTRLGLAFTHTYPVGNLSEYASDARAKLNFCWAVAPNSVISRPDTTGFGLSIFENYYLLQALHIASNLKVLTGTDMTELSNFADWIAQLPVRYVNEAIGGSFRLHFYGQDAGRDKSGGTIDSLPTWSQQLAWKTTDTPLPVSGMVMTNGGIQPTSWADAGNVVENSASPFYPAYFWAALCCAVEREVPGSDTAWSTYTNPANVTNLSTWRNGFNTSARWAYYPRNK